MQTYICEKFAQSDPTFAYVQIRKDMFTCDWCNSIHFVCFCVSRFAACDRPVSDLDRLVFFEAFYDLSYSYLLQK